MFTEYWIIYTKLLQSIQIGLEKKKKKHFCTKYFTQKYRKSKIK